MKKFLFVLVAFAVVLWAMGVRPDDVKRRWVALSEKTTDFSKPRNDEDDWGK